MHWLAHAATPAEEGHEENGENGAGGAEDHDGAEERLEGLEAQAQWVARRLRELTDPARGLLIRPLGDVIVIMPPLAISMRELEWMMGVVAECIREVTERGR